jgi:hypothetical protein
MNFQMSCNRTEWACGCVTWLEWKRDQWVLMRSRNYLRPPHLHEDEARP